MSNLDSASGEGSGSSGNRADGSGGQGLLQDPTSSGATAAMSDIADRHQTAVKRKRNLPGTPDPDAEVIALSPKTLMATNRFVCEICHKGFQRDQNLQLHRRGHNLPWKLRQRTGNEIRKRVYVCPEPSCVHHEPSRALGDLTGIKKHFCRKHGEKKWKCDKCSKRYAVQSDWKAHLKICGTREYRCDCGTFFSRRDSFITHRAFCDALAEENARISAPKHGESQQSGGQDCGANGSAGGPAVPSVTPSSPHNADSQLSEDPTDALTTSGVSKIAMCDGMPPLALTESGIRSLSSRSKGVTGANSSADTLTKDPRLSLWLGSGPGPGPPVGLPVMGGPRVQHTRDSDPAIFAIPMSRGTTDGVPGVFGSEGCEATRSEKAATGMLPFSTGAGGIFANAFAPGNDCSGSQGARNVMAGMPVFTGTMDISNAIAGFPFSSAGVAGSVSSWSGFESACAPSQSSSNYKQQQHTASAQMSATALLQKAAQMGATASSPSLFRGFGLGTGDSSSIGQRQASRQEQGRAATTSVLPSSSLAYPPSMRRPGGPSSNSQELCSLGSSILRQGRSNGSSSVQEFMNSLSGGGGLLGSAFLGYMPSLLGSSINSGKHQKVGEKAQEFQSNVHPVRSAEATQAGLGGLRISEDGVDRQTHDFLGVGRPNGTAGSGAGMGRTLSHKDLASITSLGTTMLMEPFTYQNNNLQPIEPRPHSPGNSWGSP